MESGCERELNVSTPIPFFFSYYHCMQTFMCMYTHMCVYTLVRVYMCPFEIGHPWGSSSLEETNNLSLSCH